MSEAIDKLPEFISSITETNLFFIEEAEKHFTVMNESLANISGLSNFDKIGTSFIQLKDYSTEINSVVTSIQESLKNFQEFSKDLKGIIKQFEEVAKKLDNDFFKKQFTEVKRDIIAIKKKIGVTSHKGPIGRLASREFAGVKKQVMPLLQDMKVQGLFGGGFIGGLLGIIVYGVEEQQKQQALSGQALNIYTEAFDSVVGTAVQKASSWLGAFAYTAEKLLGIPADEILHTQKVFMDAGASIKETYEDVFDAGLGFVGTNLLTYTLALDKMFELSSGTTAERTVDYMKRYGLSSKDAAKSITEMFYYGRQLGIGSEEFVSGLEKSSDALEQMGYRLTDVVELSVALQEKFRTMGTPKFLSAKVVMEGLKDIAQGMAGSDTNMKGFLAEAMGYGRGVEGYMKFMDNMNKILSEGNEEMFKNDMIRLTQKLMEIFNGDLAKMFMFIESSDQGIGWGVNAAQVILSIADALKSGNNLNAFKDPVKLKQFMTDMKESYGVESRKKSDVQRAFNDWLIEISKLGQEMLGVLGDLLALAVVFFRGLGLQLSNFFSNKSDADKETSNRNISDAINVFTQRLSNRFDSIERVMANLPGHFKAVGLAAAGEAANAGRLATHWDFDKPPSLQTPSGPIIMYVPVIQQQGVSQGDAGMNRSVFTGANGVSRTPGMSADAVKGAIEGLLPTGPYQSNLHAVPVGSINGSGALQLGVEGDCPRCGLKFVSGKNNVEDAAKPEATPAKKEEAKPVAKPAAKDGPFMVNIRSRGKGGEIDMSGGQGGGFISSITSPDDIREKQGIQQLDPKLIERLKAVAEAYPGKTINIDRTWGGGESEHAKGKAIDFSVKGVSKEELFKTLHTQNKTGGLGYYSDPSVPFVHMDVRDKAETWVDKSASGAKSDYVGKPAGAKGTDMAQVNEYLKTNLGIETPRGKQ